MRDILPATEQERREAQEHQHQAALTAAWSKGIIPAWCQPWPCRLCRIQIQTRRTP